MHLFYTPNINELFLDKEESKHCIKVLRLKESDKIILIDGKGGFARAEISYAHEKQTRYKVLKTIINYLPLPYYLHIAVAPTKNINRFEWFIEKATEIGVSEITPIISENSERKIIKTERIHKIIVSSCKQSQKAFFPVLNEAVSFSSFINNSKNSKNLKLIAHCDESERIGLDSVKINDNITIVIGPEGDFTGTEINLAIQNEFIPVTFGNSRLRTETAAIFACAAISIMHKKINKGFEQKDHSTQSNKD